ncbi:MAG TPA: outer membrane lipoprotein carrier protein LolA [Candidatus Acidoferrum sp.]|nr:outer membrane lipoprotein carrier protein LolA [Candidatus Acidoferrum sp.]
MTIFFGLVLGLFSLVSGTADTHHLVSLLEARYRPAHTMQARFFERYSEDHRVIRSEAGTVYFRRKGKMRWEYEAPEKNLFLVDGKTAWFYVPADHTVTRVPAKQSTDWRTPLALLAGEMKLSRICSSIEPTTVEKPDTPGNIVLYCPLRGEESKPQHTANDVKEKQETGSKESVYLEISPARGDLARVLLLEEGGVAIEFKFADWRFDPQLPESLFRFEVPSGVAIVNGEPQAESRP